MIPLFRTILSGLALASPKLRVRFLLLLVFLFGYYSLLWVIKEAGLLQNFRSIKRKHFLILDEGHGFSGLLTQELKRKGARVSIFHFKKHKAKTQELELNEPISHQKKAKMGNEYENKSQEKENSAIIGESPKFEAEKEEKRENDPKAIKSVKKDEESLGIRPVSGDSEIPNGGTAFEKKEGAPDSTSGNIFLGVSTSALVSKFPFLLENDRLEFNDSQNERKVDARDFCSSTSPVATMLKMATSHFGPVDTVIHLPNVEDFDENPGAKSFEDQERNPNGKLETNLKPSDLDFLAEYLLRRKEGRFIAIVSTFDSIKHDKIKTPSKEECHGLDSQKKQRDFEMRKWLASMRQKHPEETSGKNH